MKGDRGGWPEILYLLCRAFSKNLSELGVLYFDICGWSSARGEENFVCVTHDGTNVLGKSIKSKILETENSVILNPQAKPFVPSIERMPHDKEIVRNWNSGDEKDHILNPLANLFSPCNITKTRLLNPLASSFFPRRTNGSNYFCSLGCLCCVLCQGKWSKLKSNPIMNPLAKEFYPKPLGIAQDLITDCSIPLDELMTTEGDDTMISESSYPSILDVSTPEISISNSSASLSEYLNTECSTSHPIFSKC